jgi:hypothetical protein
MRRFLSKIEPAAGAEIESDPETEQLVDPLRRLGGDDRSRALVAKSGARDDGVLKMSERRIFFEVERRGDAALRPCRIRFFDRAFGGKSDGLTVRCASKREQQPGRPRSDDEHVGAYHVTAELRSAYHSRASLGIPHLIRRPKPCARCSSERGS